MPDLSTQEKAIALYTYLKELSALKQKTITDIAGHRRVLYLKDLLGDPENIKISYRDRTDSEDEDADPMLIAIRKPEFKRCPEPGKAFEQWLMPGWEDYRNKPEHRSEILVNKRTGKQELWETKAERVDAYSQWLKERSSWQAEQAVIANTRAIFAYLYDIYTDLKKESETMELVVADGFLMDRENPSVNHPIITRRVALRFNALKNILTIEDVDVETELYGIVLQLLSNVDLSAVPELNTQLRENDYHPMDRNDTPDYLKAFVHSLSSDSLYSAKGIPSDWQDKNRFLMYSQPVFIFRKMVDGTPGYLDHVIENISQTGWVPSPIAETVEEGMSELPAEAPEETIEEQLAAVGGEDPDILLVKEANREQLEIAQRIDLYNAVLVQGPPGTGKTHTIANLMGHFLAQGKSILVTSQTQKALQVLKDKLPENLQPLCVSLINDSNEDLEKSVDGITEYLSKKTSNELHKEAEQLKEERLALIGRLAEVRKSIFNVISREYTNIVFDGEELSPAKAAKFVLDNQEELGYIPGRVTPYAALPLNYQQLSDLYRSNEGLAAEDERELECELPAPEEIMDADTLDQTLQQAAALHQKLEELSAKTGWNVRYGRGKETLIDMGSGNFSIPVTGKEALDNALRFVEGLGSMEDWMKYAAVDGQKGGAYASRWETLIQSIEQVCSYAEGMVEERFGKQIEILNDEGFLQAADKFARLSDLYAKKENPGKLDFLFHKDLEQALGLVRINGEKPSSKKDMDLCCHLIQLIKLRRQCSLYWKDLLEKSGVPAFEQLDLEEPEIAAREWIEPIRKNLNWFTGTYQELVGVLADAGIQADDLMTVSATDNPMQKTEKILSAVRDVIPSVLTACRFSLALSEVENALGACKAVLRKDMRLNSAVCCALTDAMDNQDVEEYRRLHGQLSDLYDKYYLQQNRWGFLDSIGAVAPDWADAIRNREGIHGGSGMPARIEDAWRWKQYSAIIAQVVGASLEDLMAESLELSGQYRKLTGQYAEKLSWYHLMTRTETDLEMRRALSSWKLTVKKIGKGTGKNAPKFKAEARKLMAKCQKSVPAWIMPMNKVVDSLDPRENQFDVIIVDEASQSDVTALGVLYLGKKMIIVGDDKQVSPMAVGTDADRMTSLEDMYLKGKVPSAHLYSAQTSLYDIVMTTYQPLMLREHFRCVPDIIGFSNMLSYDYNIKPLRDSGAGLTPAVVSYKVEGGKREGKRNPNEARAIAALIQACIEQPEYDGKTFGVISMLGDDQAKLVYNYVYKHIGPQQLDERRIICGNPANFQGDERDVIFLSLVDSPSEKGGQLSLVQEGAGEAYKKRYNVAASRAKDQLWVTSSLDAAEDLKPGDIRRRLIEYAEDPESFANPKAAQAEEAFALEDAVAAELTERGYRLERNHPAGGYNLGLTVIGNGKHAAVECDGDRRRSPAKIRQDMERQTILERAGWTFIRVRGSEFYSNPKKALLSLTSRLDALGIKPLQEADLFEEKPADLLYRVKTRAQEILESFTEAEPDPQEDDPMESLYQLEVSCE